MNTKIIDFEKAHQSCFAKALEEIKHGQKQSHWMWYIFPQIYGLGVSETTQHYAICNLDEAKAFVEHPIFKYEPPAFLDETYFLSNSDS